jgi:hypothetical protein
LEHFKKLQGKLEFHQNKCHLTQGGSVQRPLTSGPRGWLADRPHFVASRGLASQARSPRGGNKESKVESQWKPDLVAARPCVLASRQHLVHYQLNQVSNSSLDRYKYPMLVECKIPHPTCSSPLVKFLV